ncbi:MAG: hypothetical protein LUC33_02815 [Prevotellaceae bacterium]|nr:hypothetical protein [Prevotellaceae bacterium]
MKKTILGMALVALVSVSASAQEQRQRLSDEEIAAKRAEMVQKQADKLAKDMSLSDDAKTQFVALYTEYQEALAAAREQNRGEQPEQAGDRSEKKQKELTDEEATERIQQQFARQEAQIAQSQAALDVQKQYYAKFQETLTPQQLLKVFAQQQRGNRGQGGPQGGPQGGGRQGGMPGGPGEGGMPGGDF